MFFKAEDNAGESLCDITAGDSGLWLLKNKFLFGLADCNNFYCSTHELFDPTLRGVPHVTMSNNHTCIISRSKLAKAMGYKMSQPEHELREKMRQDGVRDFSSNYEYYQSMSNRVFIFVSQFCDIIERYSIDELFLLFKNFDQWNLAEKGREIVYKTSKGVGVPICLGLGPTKLLAKIANRLAKKRPNCAGVVALQSDEEIRTALLDFPVEEIWGVGPAYAKFLFSWNIYTAQQLAEQPEYWVKQHLTIQGQRIWYELRGISCIPMEETAPDKKHICTSRSFTTPVNDRDLVYKHVANHAVKCAYKLRKDGLNCSAITVFLHTDKYKEQVRQYNAHITIPLDSYANATRIIVGKAHEGLDKIYLEGYAIKKTGVMVIDLVPAQHKQTAMILPGDKPEKTFNNETESRLSTALDRINNRYGRDTIQLGAQGNEKELQLKAHKLCPCYTTRIEDIMKIRIG